jgi:hypothetical protein
VSAVSTGEPLGSATVEAHVAAGTITARRRTTADDLLFAAEWLMAYEGDPDDDRPNMEALAAVARYLANEAQRREARNGGRQ